MKKITLLVMLATSFCMQSTAQTANAISAAELRRTQNIHQKVERETNSFAKDGSVKSYLNNHDIQKRGGAPAIAVAYSDDFSAPSDTNGLKARGYLPYYRGTGVPGTTPCWDQGLLSNWGDYNTGTNGEYVTSDYNSVTLTNNIDNWLVTPALNVSVGDNISFYSRSVLGSTFPDSIRVMYSAAGDSTPEGLTWVELGRFKVNTLGTWDQSLYTVATAGATARFAIRYTVAAAGPNGSNSFRIGVDQLDIYTSYPFDVKAQSISKVNSTYTYLPLSQNTTSVSFSGVVKNEGLNATTGGTALFELVDTLTSSVLFSETVNLPNLAIGASANIAATNTYNVVATGHLRNRLTINYSGDGNIANDIVAGTVTVYSDSVFARDYDNTTTSLGIGAGPGQNAAIGQNFEVVTPTTLTSISFKLQDFFDPNPAGTPIWATIHSQVPLAAPGTVLATTDTLVFMPGGVATGGEWFTLRLDGNSLPLTAGTYFIALHEVDSTLALGTSPEILTPSSVWVTWATMPTPTINGWNTSESFNIFIQYNLRMNFGVSTISVNEIEGNSNLISLFPSPAVNEVNIHLDNQLKNSNIAVYNSIGALVSSINNVNGNTKLDVSTFAHGIYTVIVSAEGKSYSKRFTIAK